MKNMARGIVISVCLIGMAGCRIDFEAKSVVHEDGTMERWTVLKAQEDSDKEELMSRYELSEGGHWLKMEVSLGDGKGGGQTVKEVPAYRVRKVYTPWEWPGTDFKRFTREKDQAAHNEFKVRMTDGWMIRWYDYEERFIDTVDREDRKEVVISVLKRGLEEFRLQLDAAISDISEPGLLDGVVRELRLKFEPGIRRLIQVFDEKGVSSEEFQVLNEKLEDEMAREKIAEFLQGRFSELRSEGCREKIIVSLEKAGVFIEEQFRGVEEKIFGAHGFPVLQSYYFTVDVKMPGYVVDTNAHKREKGGLRWEFSNENFEQILKARSRKVYPDRVLLSGLVLLLVGLLIVWNQQRVRGVKSKRSGLGIF